MQPLDGPLSLPVQRIDVPALVGDLKTTTLSLKKRRRGGIPELRDLDGHIAQAPRDLGTRNICLK